jgi:transposase
MGISLSDDLRLRVVEAVEAGASRRQAAARFGVSIASAVRWLQAWRERGSIGSKPQGGDHRSARIEAEAAFLLDQIKRTPDVTLAELQAKLGERGVSAAISTLWRFFDRRGISFKKNRARGRAGAA